MDNKPEPATETVELPPDNQPGWERLLRDIAAATEITLPEDFVDNDHDGMG